MPRRTKRESDHIKSSRVYFVRTRACFVSARTESNCHRVLSGTTADLRGFGTSGSSSINRDVSERLFARYVRTRFRRARHRYSSRPIEMRCDRVFFVNTVIAEIRFQHAYDPFVRRAERRRKRFQASRSVTVDDIVATRVSQPKQTSDFVSSSSPSRPVAGRVT